LTATPSLAAAGCATTPDPKNAMTTPDPNSAATALLDETISIDLHSHPGMFRTLARATMDGQIERLAAGRVRGSLFSAVGDAPVLSFNPQGGVSAVREPQPGELYRATYLQIEQVRTRITSGKLALVERSADVARARGEGRHAAVLAVEGGDFLEGRLDRVQEGYDRGIRSIQLVHYRVNELGDIQTEPPRHGGLTSFGRDVIREMNRLGMLVDVAHATFDCVSAAAETSSKPMVLSHTVVDVPHARAVTREHARLMAQGGGVVGVFPSSFGGPGFSGYIDHLSRMADAVGVDHVVDEATLVVQQPGVDRLPVGAPAEVVGDQRVGALQRPLPAELDLPHVRDIEHPRGLPHRLVLRHHPAVLDGHVPAGEVDHPAAVGDVPIVKRGPQTHDILQECRMTKSECRKNDEARMTKDSSAASTIFLDFVI
jgi:microsomal dipeptidase-like Zn-dependent dipeptidase